MVYIPVQTTSNNIQAIIESRIEKRTKGVFVPAGGKHLLCFLDDLNMPAHDLFGSQPPLELLRLWIDCGFWYDRQKQTRKFVKVSEKYACAWLAYFKKNLILVPFLCTFVCFVRTWSCWLQWGPLVEGGHTFLNAYRADLTSSIWPFHM